MSRSLWHKPQITPPQGARLLQPLPRPWVLRRDFCTCNARKSLRSRSLRCVATFQSLRVYVPSHPLVNHWLAVCRNKASPPPIFRSAVAELGRVLIYEAAQDWLPTVSGQVETPLGPADCSFVDPTRPVKVVPILRAGLVLLEQAATVLPSSETYHVGYVRDEKTLEASEYLNKLPPKFAADDRVLVCDPMLATGGTMLRLLNELVSRGASQEYIRVISVVVAPPALNLISKQYPGLRVYCGMVDEALNEQGMIVPGLGDAGDRAFGTA